MGFDRWGLDFIAGCAAQEPLAATATIGRQWLHADRSEVAGIVSRDFPQLGGGTFDGFADELLVEMGASRVVSFDASGYEGATVLHDMNEPLPDEHRRAYDTVIESGSLEHVFDVKTALANVMDMPRVGGRVLLSSPANNQLGHGFYQFSPELYFRAFSAEQGYQLESLHVVTNGLRPQIFAVTDPAVLGRRAEMLSAAPVYLFLQARRTEVRPLFARPLQQSDYSAAWDGIRPASSQATAEPAPSLVKKLPLGARYPLRFAVMFWRLRVQKPGMSKVDAFR